ncbi:RpnC/YadD family protein [Spirosoma areae]
MKRQHTRQASQYDKILKENLEATIPALIEKVLNIHPVLSEELPDDLQHTKERKPDALKRITDQSGQLFVLHLEFQLANEPKMIHRMHTYCAMLLEQYEIPVRQYVFYLGPTPARMPTSLTTNDLSFRYNLISFQELDYRLFLTSETPEVILLTILANYQPQESPMVMKQLLTKLDETADGPLVFQKYIAQLRVLVQLRNLQPLLDAAMDNLTKYVNEQNDPFYVKGRNLGFLLGTEKGIQEGLQKGIQEGLQKGIQEGLQKGIRAGEEKGESKAQFQLIKNLLAETDFSDDKIAHLVGVTLTFVQDVRRVSASN